MIVLDPASEVGLYEQLYQQLRDDIATGRLPKGSRLKSLRELEQDLNVSRTTVSRAYQQLVSEGYVRASQGSGYYVDDIGPTALEEGKAPVSAPVFAENKRSFDYDFSPFNVESSLFPWKKWRKALGGAVDFDSFSAVSRHASSKGTLQLRENLARFLYHHRGVRCTPEQIVVCTNDLRAVDVLVSMLDLDTSRFAFEEPGVARMRNLIIDWGFEVVSVPALGQQVLPLLEAGGCNVVFTMPSCQLPAGSTMSLRDRNLLLRWATEHDAYIIEFDHHARFQGYGNTEVPSMQSLDRYGSVIYVGTLSEVLPPSLDLAYIVLPPGLLDRYRMRYDLMPPMLPEFYEQAFADILEDGTLIRHIRRTEVENKSKLGTLVRCIEEQMPSRARVVNGSISGYAIVEIKTSRDRQEIIEQLAREGVRIYSIYDSCHEECSSWDDLFVMGIGSISESNIAEGVKRIAHVLDSSADDIPSTASPRASREFKEAFEEAVAKMQKDVAVELVRQVVSEGKGTLGYVEEGLSLGIKRISDMFDKGEIGVVELIEAADVLDASLRVFTSSMTEEERETSYLGSVVLYTVEGDLHDLGKNIIRVLLEANNIKVYDLGCNVSPEAVLDAAEGAGASVIMGSALMTTTVPAQKDLINAMLERGVRDKYFVMFGGAPVTEDWVRKIGGDAYTETATDAVIAAKNHVVARVHELSGMTA